VLTLFRKLQRHDFGFGDDPERTFPDLLLRVLRELANPAPPAQLATRIQRCSSANHFAHSERNFAMTMQPLAAGTNDSNRNPRMFTPLDANGSRGMSRSSIAFAVVFNAAFIGVLCVQVHHRIVDERPRAISIVAPVEKPPVAPKFLARVTPLRTAAVQPNAPVILHRAAEVMPAPVAVVPVLRHDAVVVPMTAPTPRVVPAAAAPTMRLVALNASPVAIQPTGPSVASINLDRSSIAGPAGAPAATSVSLAGPRRSGVGPAVGPAGPVHLSGCIACQTGNAIPRPVEPRTIPRLPTSDMRPIAVAQVPAGRSVPTVLFKPKPNYTAEATELRIEGAVKVKIRVSADGTVTVLGIPSGLGHGLDESATQCAEGIRFRPAVDASGQPVAWEGVVTITFQMS